MTRKGKQNERLRAEAKPKRTGASGKYERVQQEVIDGELGVTIFKYAPEISPNWYVQYNHPQDGQKQPSLRTGNLKEARRKAWEIVTKLRKGTLDKNEIPAAKFGDVIESFLENKLRVGRTETTVVEYRRHLNQFQHFMARLKITRLDQVTPNDMEKFEKELRSTGINLPSEKKRRGARARPNSGGSVLDKIKLVKGLFKWAVRRKLLLENTVEAYELPADTKPNNYCFTPEEVKKLCSATDPFFAMVFKFLAFTGLRQSELFWLTKEDLNVSRKLIHIRPKSFSNGWKWSPKNDERKVPLCEEALAIAIEGFEKPDTRWLFPAPPAPGVKDDLLRPYRLWKRLQDAKKATGIKNGKIHSFRHFFVSQAANSGVSPFKLMTIVGHKALDIILTYYHVDPDELLNAVHQIDFGVLTSPK